MNLEYVRPYIPEIRSLRSIEVQARTPIVLNDVRVSQLKPGVRPGDIDVAVQTLFASSFRAQPVFIKSGDLSAPMTSMLQEVLSGVDSSSTMVIFPGDGAQAVYEKCWKPSIEYERGNVFTNKNLKVERIFENGTAQKINIILSDAIQDALDSPQYKSILVIDDVIATGETMAALRKRLEYAPYRYSFIGISWFCRIPTDMRAFDKTYSLFRYSSTEGYPALNSVSTWLRTDEKGLAVRESYKRKYIRYPYGFDKEIAYIRSLTTIT